MRPVGRKSRQDRVARAAASDTPPARHRMKSAENLRKIAYRGVRKITKVAAVLPRAANCTVVSD